ncbi:hypothetical protein Uis1B_2168 [Bifidobacterium margollesii]|uniref:Transmembrane protein n=1 Tax=Bifidobacterium margollesii TaxID=2020964 RepID=A0A2N5J711_9BIFI|nr:hypothetical protein Uis1B_2168 [Bifidobacterium margollesii]
MDWSHVAGIGLALWLAFLVALAVHLTWVAAVGHDRDVMCGYLRVMAGLVLFMLPIAGGMLWLLR